MQVSRLFRNIKVNYKALCCILFILLLAAVLLNLFLINFSSDYGGKYIFNGSPSHTPIGIYEKVCVLGANKKVFFEGQKADYKLKKGDLVNFSIADLYDYNNSVRDNYYLSQTKDRNFLKFVGATAGSVITLDSNNCVVIDGKRIFSARVFPKYKNGQDRLKIKYPYKVPAGSVFLVSDSLHSFDSRYYGAIPEVLVQYKIKPVITYTGAWRF